VVRARDTHRDVDNLQLSQYCGAARKIYRNALRVVLTKLLYGAATMHPPLQFRGRKPSPSLGPSKAVVYDSNHLVPFQSATASMYSHPIIATDTVARYPMATARSAGAEQGSD
jgi:hypothetical protein